MSKLSPNVLVLSALVLGIAQPAFSMGRAPSTPSSPSSGSTSNLTIPGVVGPIFAVNTNFVSVTVILKNIQVDVGADIPISGMPNSYISVTPDVQSGGTDLGVTLDVTDIKIAKHIGLIQPDTLPGGRPLPGIPDGHLPAIAVQLKTLDNAVVYIGPSVFGVFVPVSIKVSGLIVTAAFHAQSGTTVGTLSMVGNDAKNQNGGFLLLLNDSAVGISLDPFGSVNSSPLN